MTDTTFYRVITRDDTGKRWVETRNTEDDSVYSVHEHWTLTERIDRLRSAGFRVSFARIGEWRHVGPWSANEYEWDAYERCPSGVSYSDVSTTDYFGGYDGSFIRAFVDLGEVGRGDDRASQTDHVQFSNLRSLWRDFPDGTFTNIRYSNVDTLGAYVGNLSEDVIDILTGLRTDYPLYDEEDDSSLELEITWNAWDEWLGRDVRRHLEDSSESDEAMEDALDKLGDNTLRKWFYESYSDGSDYPYLEYMDAVFPDWETHASELESQVWAWRCAEFTAPIPGQETLPV